MFRTMLAAAAMTAATTAAAAAQEAGSGYIQLGAGPFIPTRDNVRQEVEILGEIVGVESAIDYATGFGAFGLYGYRVSRTLALEAEYAFRQSDIDAVTLLTDGFGLAEPVEGSTTASTYMASAVLHAPIPLPVKPYAGGGIGYASLDTDGLADIGGAFAYQVKAGASVPIFIGELGLEARYLAAADIEGEDGVATASVEFGGVDVLGTFRYNF